MFAGHLRRALGKLGAHGGRKASFSPGNNDDRPAIGQSGWSLHCNMPSKACWDGGSKSARWSRFGITFSTMSYEWFRRNILCCCWKHLWPHKMVGRGWCRWCLRLLEFLGAVMSTFLLVSCGISKLQKSCDHPIIIMFLRYIQVLGHLMMKK